MMKGQMMTPDLCLCNLIVMVGELEVHSSSVDVCPLPENVTGRRKERGSGAAAAAPTAPLTMP